MAKASRRPGASRTGTVKVLGYVRVSTDEQVTEGVSIAAQESRIRSYCNLHGLQLVHVYVEDEGQKSAKSLDRRALRELFAALEQKEADGLVVAKLDRLTRRMRDWTDLLEGRFSEGGSLLFSVAEHVETRSAAGRLMLNMLMSMAQWERETISERTSEALRHLAETGCWAGGRVPYGWRPGPREVDARGRRLPRKLVKDEDEQAVVREVFKQRDGGASLRAICAKLTELGYRPRLGAHWSPQAISNILASRAAKAVG